MPRSGIAGSYGSPTFSFLSNLNSPFVASLVAQMVKNLPAMQETWVQSLGQEDPLEKGMAPHCSILAWKIPWTLLNRCLSACKCRGCAYLVRPEWKAWMVFRFAGHSPKWSKGAPVSFCQIFCLFPYLLENIPSCPSLSNSINRKQERFASWQWPIPSTRGTTSHEPHPCDQFIKWAVKDGEIWKTEYSYLRDY